MKKIGVVLFWLGVSAIVPARGETIEEVEKKLLEAHAQLKSYTANIKHKERVELTGEDFMSSNVSGSVEWMRKGSAYLYRMEIVGTSIHMIGGKEQKTDQSSVLVSDGTFFYTFAEQLGQKRYIKQKVDNSIIGDIRSVLDTVRSVNNFKLGTDEKVEGADCYVIEVTPKTPPGDDNPIHITLIYFRKDNGLNVRVLSRNKDGKDVYDHTLVDLKTGVSIDASRFVLHPPYGVEVTDLTDIEDATATPAPESKPAARP